MSVERIGLLLLLSAATASAQTVDVAPVTGGNALSTVMQRHLVRVEPAGGAPTLLLALQRDERASPDGEGLHWYRSDDEGRSWRHYARIIDDGIAGRELHLTADVLVVGEDLAVVYSYDTTQTLFSSDASDPQRKVYFQWWRHDGAGDWRPDPRLTVGAPASGHAYHRANLALDSLGRIWVQGWYRSPCPPSAGVECTDTLRLWVSTDGGVSFQAQPDLISLPRLGGGRVISLGTRLMVLWGEYSWDNPARYAVREDSAPLDEWEGPRVAFPDGDAIYHGAAFNAVADGRGGLHLVFKDRREQLYYRYFDGTSFGARTFVDGEAYWAVQPAITLHGSELYVCSNHYRAATGTFELHSRKLSDRFASRVVLESTRDGKYYPTAPERVPAQVPTIPCAYTTTGGSIRTRVSLQSASSSQTPDFSLSAQPAQLGGEGTSTLRLEASGGFEEEVGLTVSGVPAGAEATLTPTSLQVGPEAASASLQLSVGSAAPGVYALSITAQGGGLTRSALVTWTVPSTEEPPPGGGSVTRAFQDGVSPAGYSGTRDTTLVADQPTLNRGSAAEASADGSPDETLLLSWDLGSIPTGSTVLSAAITVEVTNSSSGSYELYPLRSPWEESSATWRVASAGRNWAVAGAQGAADRDPTVVGTLSGPVTGTRGVPLNEAGVAMVQRWVSDPGSNFGVIVQDYSGSSDGLDLSTRESGVALRRPRLEVTYVEGSTLPQVSLLATDPHASELALDPGRLSLSRTGSTTEALTVHYQVGGTASVSADYQPLEGTVELPPGSASVELSVIPVDDALIEGTETVVITLSSGPDYAVGSPGSATVNLADDETPAPPPPPPPAEVTVSFQQGVAPGSGYSGARDASILSGSPSTNFGSASRLEVDGSPDQSVLMAWDLSSIPPGSVVQSASLTIRVENPSVHTYAGYELRRAWTEGQVTWSRFDGVTGWQVPGGLGTADRGAEALLTLSASATGSASVNLTPAGVALVQRWISQPDSNLGLILLETPGASDGLDFLSREGTASGRPRLTVRYLPPP